MSGGASENAPPLTAPRQALLVAPVRLTFGPAGLAAAVSIDVGFRHAESDILRDGAVGEKNALRHMGNQLLP